LVADAAYDAVMDFVDNCCKLDSKDRHLKSISFENIDSRTNEIFITKFKTSWQSQRPKSVSYDRPSQLEPERNSNVEEVSRSSSADAITKPKTRTASELQHHAQTDDKNSAVSGSKPVTVSFKGISEVTPLVGQGQNDANSTQLSVPECASERRRSDVSPREAGPSVKSDEKFQFTFKSGLVVSAFRGEIVKEKVNAIVCSTNTQLDFNSDEARTIAAAAGTSMLNEVKDFRAVIETINVTEAIHTTAGNLRPSVHFVILLAEPTHEHTSDQKELKSVLTRAYLNCLLYANVFLRIRSVSVPAICAGE
jgi:O-acetyl-ADP-ribose deacetylase (regulator of RNase III)